jgi:hypothetical protein
MGFQKLDEYMNEKVDRKSFIKDIGILCLGLTIMPSLIDKLVNLSRFKMIGDNIYLDDELVIQRRDE